MKYEKISKVMDIILIVVMTIAVLGEGVGLSFGNIALITHLEQMECESVISLAYFTGAVAMLFELAFCIFIDWAIIEIIDSIRRHWLTKHVYDEDE